jgi:hypothetical protein
MANRPVEDHLSLPLQDVNNVKDTLHAYQLSKRWIQIIFINRC